MSPDSSSARDVDREARDWMVRVQLGDTSGPGETARGRLDILNEFQAWKNADPANAAAYERLQSTMQKAGGWGQHERVGQSRLTRVPFASRHPFMMSVIAAAFVGVVGMAAYRYVGPAAADGEPAHQQLASTIYMTGVGQSRQISLPDGSSVLLDADSQIRVYYSKDSRSLRLDHGRARFTVAHDPARPFAVDAGNSRVIAHGTIFDVAVGPRRVHVALLRGAIEVARPTEKGGAAGTGSKNLVPGQQLSFDPVSMLPDPQQSDPGELEWVSGRLSFRDTRLGDAVDEINRYNQRKITVADPGLAEMRVSGGYEARKPEAFAKAVALALQLDVNAQGTGPILLSKSPLPNNTE